MGSAYACARPSGSSFPYPSNSLIKSRSSYKDFKIQQEKKRIQNFLLDKGYYANNVSIFIEEEKNNLINESFTSNSSSFEIDKNNSINFNTRRNNEKSATEFYNLIYNYKNDCLVAGLKYNKTYYKDRDLEPSEDFMLSIKLIPLTA